MGVAQQEYTPGQGCCLDATTSDLTLTQSYALNLDDMYDDIPAGSHCEKEWVGLEAQLLNGNWVQDMRAACQVPDAGLVHFRSLSLDLANGTGVDAAIKYYANGTVDAKCDMGAHSLRNKGPTPYCVGPSYGDIYVGAFTYGSAPVERYARPLYADPLNGTLDFDVQNGCIPITILTPDGDQIRINNYKLEHQVLPPGTFDIPPECFQQAESELPAWAQRAKAMLV